MPFSPGQFFFFFLKILFIWERASERASEHVCMREYKWKEGQREKHMPCWAGSQNQGSIPGPWDYDLSQRQKLNQLSHPGAPVHVCCWPHPDLGAPPWILLCGMNRITIAGLWIPFFFSTSFLCCLPSHSPNGFWHFLTVWNYLKSFPTCPVTRYSAQ